MLHGSDAVVGVSADGLAAVWRPGSETATHLHAPPPPAAGPAVDPQEDAWYFADRVVTEYRLSPEGRAD